LRPGRDFRHWHRSAGGRRIHRSLTNGPVEPTDAEIFRAHLAARAWLPEDDRRCPAKRAGTPDEVGNVAELLMGAEETFITVSDFLMEGGVTASCWFGELAPK
jgi:hypothetical protein